MVCLPAGLFANCLVQPGEAHQTALPGLVPCGAAPSKRRRASGERCCGAHTSVTRSPALAGTSAVAVPTLRCLGKDVQDGRFHTGTTWRWLGKHRCHWRNRRPLPAARRLSPHPSLRCTRLKVRCCPDGASTSRVCTAPTAGRRSTPTRRAAASTQFWSARDGTWRGVRVKAMLLHMLAMGHGRVWSVHQRRNCRLHAKLRLRCALTGHKGLGGGSGDAA